MKIKTAVLAHLIKVNEFNHLCYCQGKLIVYNLRYAIAAKVTGKELSMQFKEKKGFKFFNKICIYKEELALLWQKAAQQGDAMVDLEETLLSRKQEPFIRPEAFTLSETRGREVRKLTFYAHELLDAVNAVINASDSDYPVITLEPKQDNTCCGVRFHSKDLEVEGKLLEYRKTGDDSSRITTPQPAELVR